MRLWAEPAVTAVGRLPMAATFHVVERPRLALNGSWDFAWFDHPDRVPAPDVLAGRSDAGDEPAWRPISVPGNWTLQDTPDVPHYTNVDMPWPLLPPALPSGVSTGVYRRTFRVPTPWKGSSVVLHLGGAESVHTVHLNGEFVGYGTDSRLGSEYDLTDRLRRGANVVTVTVSRYSAHSYVEDQDQWWMAGLHREVFLEARPSLHLADLVVDAGLADIAAVAATPGARTTGTLRVRATVGSLLGARVGEGWRVETHLETLEGRRLGPPQGSPVAADVRPYLFQGFVAETRCDVARIEPWSAESPARYRVVARLVDPSGDVVETAEVVTGFRSVEVRDRSLLVNGRRVMIRGANRHDHHPDRGKAVTVDDMRDDLVAMKRHNINAVRCSHYPNDPRFYDLCDELGMYVVDEANIESHAFNTSLCDDPRYRSAWVERGARMVARDRNHPSVILWSLGNESGYGTNHDALAAWIRATDPTRPLHYEGAVLHRGWELGGLDVTDIVCPMYPQIDAIVAYGRDGVGQRPLIMCEYSHAMGNSNGSLWEYAEAFETTPGLQGGFLWEWKDHGLRQEFPDGRTRLAYGGQFGDMPNDGNFVADGLMSADLVAHPAMREVAWVYRPVTVGLTSAVPAGVAASARTGPRNGGSVPGNGDQSAGSLVITNRQGFRDLGWLRATWELLVDGAVVKSGRLSVPPVAPGATITVPIPAAVPAAVRPTASKGSAGARGTAGSVAGEVHLSVRWFTRADGAALPAGHLVAWDQVELRSRDQVPGQPSSKRRGRAGSSTTPVAATRAGSDLRVSVAAPADPASTGFAAEPTVWRAAVDNDGFKLMPHFTMVGSQALARWRQLGFDRGLGAVRHEVESSPGADGSVRFRHRFEVPEECADLPRVGVRAVLPAGFRRLRWFGRGPHENYPDRAAGAMLGIWEGEPDELPYLVPQEFALRTDCRWVEFSDPDRNEVVRIESLGAPFHLSATHHTAEQLFDATDWLDLERTDGLVVHLDAAHRGLGTASCGPDVRAPYRLAAGSYTLDYLVSSRSGRPNPS